MFDKIAAIAALLGGVAATGSASVVTLSLQLDTTAQTWKVYGQTSADTQGIAGFLIDVTGSGGASITGSTVKAPQQPVYDADGGFVGTAGFTQIRSNGTNGAAISAGQDPTATTDFILLNYGVASRGLLASGTYSGSSGLLTANVSSGGGLINVYPLSYVSGGATAAATVVKGVAPVPEPSLLGLGVAGAGLLGRRRSRRLA